MSNLNSIHLSKILVSRLCHDLINPTSAAKNGFDLITDDTSPQDRQDIDQFIENSVQQSLYRLVMVRSALSQGAQGTVYSSQSFQKTLNDFFISQSVECTYNNITPYFLEINGSDNKLQALLILFLSINDCLTFRPKIDLNFSLDKIDIKITGDRIILRPEVIDSFDNKIEEDRITTQNIFCYIQQQYLLDHHIELKVIACSLTVLHLQLTKR